MKGVKVMSSKCLCLFFDNIFFSSTLGFGTKIGFAHYYHLFITVLRAAPFVKPAPPAELPKPSLTPTSITLFLQATPVTPTSI